MRPISMRHRVCVSGEMWWKTNFFSGVFFSILSFLNVTGNFDGLQRFRASTNLFFCHSYYTHTHLLRHFPPLAFFSHRQPFYYPVYSNFGWYLSVVFFLLILINFTRGNLARFPIKKSMWNHSRSTCLVAPRWFRCFEQRFTERVLGGFR